jgi:hypothetical protein
VSVEPRAAALLRDLAKVLRRAGNRWFLFGAQAVTVWGRPRLSVDVDITIELPDDEVDDFVRSMAKVGFELNIPPGVEDFVRRTRVLPFVHRSTGMPLDVVLAGPGLEMEFLDRAIRTRVEDLNLPLISPEDLVIGKLLAGRPKDIEDVTSVLRERAGSLDLERIHSVLRLVEEALSQSDMVPTFERLLKAAR